MESKFPTRLVVQCPDCGGQATVNRDHYAAAQMFCANDGMPLIVRSVIAGVPRDAERIQHQPFVIVSRTNKLKLDAMFQLVGSGVDV
jgi:hypothetical protein